MLTQTLLEDFYDHLNKVPGRNGKLRAPITCVKHIERVQDAWRWAFDHDDYGPFVPKPKSIELPTISSKRVVSPTWAEMDACIDASRGWYRRLLLVQRYTGLRVNQVMRLLWSDIDVENAVLNFRGELGKTKCEKRGRIIPISRHLADELATWGTRDGWLIKSGRKQEGPRARLARAREVNRYWKKAGVRPEVWSGRPDHSFRKGVVTEMKRGGADAEAAEYLVGHSLEPSRDPYLDADALPLRHAVAVIPPFGEHRKVAKLTVTRAA